MDKFPLHICNTMKIKPFLDKVKCFQSPVKRCTDTMKISVLIISVIAILPGNSSPHKLERRTLERRASDNTQPNSSLQPPAVPTHLNQQSRPPLPPLPAQSRKIPLPIPPTQIALPHLPLPTFTSSNLPKFDKNYRPDEVKARRKPLPQLPVQVSQDGSNLSTYHRSALSESSSSSALNVSELKGIPTYPLTRQKARRPLPRTNPIPNAGILSPKPRRPKGFASNGDGSLDNIINFTD